MTMAICRCIWLWQTGRGADAIFCFLELCPQGILVKNHMGHSTLDRVITSRHSAALWTKESLQLAFGSTDCLFPENFGFLIRQINTMPEAREWLFEKKPELCCLSDSKGQFPFSENVDEHWHPRRHGQTDANDSPKVFRCSVTSQLR